MTKKNWVNAIWVILGILMFVTGFSSQNVVMMTSGLAMALGNASLYLTSHVKNDSTAKRALEVICAIAAFGIFGYGYAVTQNVLLGLMIIFIAAMILVTFTLQYILPRIRNKHKKPEELL